MSSLKAMESKKLSHHTNPMVYACKQQLWDLKTTGYEVTLMWIPAHVGIVGNEIADEGAKMAAQSGHLLESSPLPCDHRMLAKSDSLKQWQTDWDTAETGRFAHSIIPKVANKAWFEEHEEERNFVCTFSRIISGHTATHAHLNRFQILESPLCVCLENYETIDHLIWDCSRFETERTRTIFKIHNIEPKTPIRDLCAQGKWEAIKKIYLFFKDCGLKI
jgi:hypothetical protein